MKSDIALHELMRLDEFEENAHPKSADKHNSQETEMKSEESPTSSVATQATAAAPANGTESSMQSVDIPADTIINYDEPPTQSEDTSAAEPVSKDEETTADAEDTSAAELLINNDEAATESDDTAAAEALMNKDDTYQDSVPVHATELVMAAETASDSAAAGADADTSNYDEPPTELIGAPANKTVMSNDITTQELADLSAVKEIGNDDEIDTESAELPSEPAIDCEQSTPELAVPTHGATMYDGETSTEDPLAKRLEAIPTNTAGFFQEVASTTSAFFNNNRQLFTNLGVIFVVFMVTKLAFAGLNAIDDLPLVSPLLKLVGLYYVVRFIWNYALRAQDRQQLAQKFDRLKAEVLGNQN
jgi:CAAD domains of cyanobacterial aminoacyl-tRNA synthetase